MDATVEEIAYALVVSEQEVHDFLGEIFSSQSPIIKSCLLNGLPPSSSAPLPHRLVWRCDGCGEKTRYLPCVNCCSKSLVESTFRDDFLSGNEAPKTPKPTGASPGSWEKIEVMRKRFSRGESIFHDDDAILIR